MRAKLITASTQIATEKANIVGYQVVPNGSVVATINIYNEDTSDKTSALKVAGSRISATESGGEWFGDDPLYCSDGVYVELAGTGAVAYIYLK